MCGNVGTHKPVFTCGAQQSGLPVVALHLLQSPALLSYQGICPSRHKSGTTEAPDFYVDSGDLNSGPQYLCKGALPTEPAPQATPCLVLTQSVLRPIPAATALQIPPSPAPLTALAEVLWGKRLLEEERPLEASRLLEAIQ